MNKIENECPEETRKIGGHLSQRSFRKTRTKIKSGR